MTELSEDIYAHIVKGINEMRKTNGLKPFTVEELRQIVKDFPHPKHFKLRLKLEADDPMTKFLKKAKGE